MLQKSMLNFTRTKSMQSVNPSVPKVFISIVSHGHGQMIRELNCIDSLSKKYNVIIKNNCKDDLLIEYKTEHSLLIIDQDYYQGFGYNNNVVYNYCIQNLGMQSEDYFIVLNPDLAVSVDTIEKLICRMKNDAVMVATINLFKDELLTDYDNSVRNFPRLSDFFSSLILGRNNTKLDKASIKKPIKIDWCAGSFIAFSCSAFKSIRGFDTGYFMYCEDIDLCYRLMAKDYNIIYYPDLIAIHKAQHRNRSILSKHFLWHVKSAIRFILAKHNLIKNKSNIL